MDDAERLRRQVQGFVRRFGALSDARTPCGQPLPLSHAHALMLLLEAPAERPPTQSEIARALGIDKSSAARLSARLAEAGHVRREPCPEDGRAFWLRLTPAGLRLAERVTAASRARFDQLLAGLPGPKRREVIEALECLNDVLECMKKEEKP